MTRSCRRDQAVSGFCLTQGQMVLGGVRSRLAHYGVDRVLLSRERQPQLTATLGASPSWIREYADQEAEIWKSQ